MKGIAEAALRVAHPPARPTLLYDSTCGFCRHWIRLWHRAVRDAVRFEAYQTAAGKYPEIPVERLERAVHLVRSDGTVSTGARAVFDVLAARERLRWLPALYRWFRPFAVASEWVYRVVAAHRAAVSRMQRPFRRCRAAARGYRHSSALFLRGLGLIYAIAFASLWVQIHGLAGSHGIFPVDEVLDIVRARFGDRGPAIFPTLCWWWHSDAALHAMCALGVALGAMVTAGVWASAGLLMLWFLYLSMCVAGGIFLNFQWDALLLETGFLGIWMAPLSARHPIRSLWLPSPTMLFLLRWLLFRLMFLSGAAKLLSGDSAWWHLTALDFHYETQPLPNPISWYAHQLPAWFDSLCVFVMFVIELGAPFLLFGPRAAKRIGAGAILGLMFLIFITGNYAFFNLLGGLLCLTAIDDRALGRLARLLPRPRHLPRITAWPPWVIGPLGAMLFLLATQQFTDRLALPVPWPSVLQRLQDTLAPFRSINSYGLFAVMTRTRPEIIIEGSHDGTDWRAYEFRWKPGNLSRAPAFVAPHQPRLDWQMWFAALEDAGQSPWFARLLRRLKEGSPPVLALLERNPFPEVPPKYIRARLYRYRFSTPAERRTSGQWWQREEISESALRSPDS